MKNCPLCHGKVWVVCTDWTSDGAKEVVIEHREINGVRPVLHRLTATTRDERRNLYRFRIDLMRAVTVKR